MSGILVLILRLILAACLYAFLGWILYWLWQELHIYGASLSTRPTSLLTIALADYPDTEKSFSITEIVIGRDPHCEYTVIDDTVSSLHARLSYRQKQWWVEDLQSTNGSFLNDERIYTATVIISGDELRLGKACLVINIIP